MARQTPNSNPGQEALFVVEDENSQNPAPLPHPGAPDQPLAGNIEEIRREQAETRAPSLENIGHSAVQAARIAEGEASEPPKAPRRDHKRGLNTVKARRAAAGPSASDDWKLQ